MSIRKMILFIILIIIGCNFVLLFVIKDSKEANISIVEINDITESLKERWDTLGETELPGLKYGLDYVVLDSNNQLIVATRDGLNIDLYQAISNRDTIIDIKSDNVMLGKLIIYNNSNQLWQDYKISLLTFSMVSIVLVGSLNLLYTIHINKRLIQPFKKLQHFAKHVSEGNLDFPLEMDKGNHFGAFTESFDLMREELKKARENERIANQSKKELVASLSHDIKTPVASIKAVSEIMQAKTEDKYEIKQLEIINAKADQINTLITNMFNATLEELQELKVTATEESSELIKDFIKEVDYHRKVTFICKDECIVLMDALRLSQVIDNVISNSYKYAGTSIHVSIHINGKYLEVSFKDFGQGVSNDECPLLFNKFYRAKNAEGKNGAGLGLYISKYFMEKMQGDISCENVSDGFIIKLKLLIA